jgi:hypothetical protein
MRRFVWKHQQSLLHSKFWSRTDRTTDTVLKNGFEGHNHTLQTTHSIEAEFEVFNLYLSYGWRGKMVQILIALNKL